MPKARRSPGARLAAAAVVVSLSALAVVGIDGFSIHPSIPLQQPAAFAVARRRRHSYSSPPGCWPELRRQRRSSRESVRLVPLPLSISSSSSSETAAMSTGAPGQADDGDDHDEECDGAFYVSVGEADDEEEDDSALSALQLEHLAWSEALKEAVEALRRKRTSLENELGKAEQVEGMVKRANLITSNLYLFNVPGVMSATVIDWEATTSSASDNDNGDDSQQQQEPIEVELTLDPKYDGSASAEADALFEKAKKLKRGSKVVQALLDETSNALETLQEAAADLQSSVARAETAAATVNEDRMRLVQDRLLRTSKSTGFEQPPPLQEQPARRQRQQPASSLLGSNGRAVLGSPGSNVRKIALPGTRGGGNGETGGSILVGRNRRGNEYLSMSLAKPNDLWFHARGCPGAHVLLQLPRQVQRQRQQQSGRGRADGVIEEEVKEGIQMAANLAVFYSDMRNERSAPVTMTEAKHLSKPRNAPLGAVKLRKELRVVLGVPDDVPIDLKEQREAENDGLYRSSDKAKHRKQTQRAVEDERRKKKRRRQAKQSKKRGRSGNDPND